MRPAVLSLARAALTYQAPEHSLVLQGSNIVYVSQGS